MRTETTQAASLAGAILSALAASACCVGPLAFAMLGLGGAGFLVAMEPYRGFFTALTVGLLAVGVYTTYRTPQPGPDCDCDLPRTNRAGRWALWGATGVAVIALLPLADPPAVLTEASMRSTPFLFALIVGCGSPTAQAPETVTAASLASISLRVEGMTCASCEVSVRIAAGELEGVQEVAVDHEAGSAVVRYDPARITPAAIAAAITELGYPTTVEGSEATPDDANHATGFDPQMAAVCQAGCAAQEGYDPAEVVPQPGAKVSDLTQCPVSGVVFVVQADQPSIELDGETWFTCCAACMGKLQTDPARFLRG